MNSKLLKELTPRSVECLAAGYTARTFLSDLFAGITVGIVALPLAMAFAIASGVTPERGLFTAIVAGFLISFLGGSRVQIGGPTGAFVVIVAGIVAKHGYEGLAVATLMAGAMLVILGLCGLGRMIKFIPYPLTTGFTTGIAVIIFASQIRDFFGLKMDEVPSEFVEKMIAYAAHFDTLNPYALAIGIGSLAVLISFRRYFPRMPAAIVAVILSSIAVSVFSLPVETIGTRFGGIPAALPTPYVPSISMEQVRTLLPAAFTVALLAGIESLLSAVVADGMTGDRHKSNCELVGQGVANIASVFFGGIPATGAIARTATNVRAGARTPVAGMVHAIFLLAAMLLLAPLASGIPLATLAAVLFIVAWNMSELDHFRHLLKAPPNDVMILLVSFTLTVLVDLTVAVEVGVVLSALLFMKRMSEIELIDVSPVFQDEFPISAQPTLPNALLKRDIPEGVDVFEMQGPFFFGVADKVKDVLNFVHEPPKVFVLRMRRVHMIDATGLHALHELAAKCRRQKTRLILSGVHENVARKLDRMGLTDEIGPENICKNIDFALERARAVLAEIDSPPPRSDGGGSPAAHP